MKTQEKFNIVHLSKYYPPYQGGIETHVQALAQAQASLGHKVEVICVNGNNEDGEYSDKTKTVSEYDRNVAITRLGRVATMARFDICPELVARVAEIGSRRDTVLHLHTPNPMMLLVLANLLRSVPFVITHHSDIVKQKFLKYVLRPFEVLVYSRSSMVLATSRNYLDGSKFLNIYKDKVRFLPLGIDTEEFVRPNQDALNFRDDLRNNYPGPIWLVVGRLVYYKAIHLATEALCHVPGTLVIVGVGPLERNLRSLAIELGVDDRIVWLGNISRNELVGAYHAAKALWFPSNIRSEAFGLVQVEAMASSCPVINADIPGSGVSWVSRHEIEALTVPVNDSYELAKAANRMLEDDRLYSNLVEGSRKRASQFNHMVMASQSISVYNDVLAQYYGSKNQERIKSLIPYCDEEA